MKIYKESFHNVRSHKAEWLRVAYGPILIWALGFLLLVIAYISEGHSLDLQKVFGAAVGGEEIKEASFFLTFAYITYNIINFIASFILYINGYRYAILQEGGNEWFSLNLNMRFLKMVLYTLLLAILGGIYVGISAGIIWGAHSAIENMGVNVILACLLVLYGLFLMFRIILFPVAISIDQRAPLKTSWHLMKGNIWRFIGLSSLVALTLMLIGIIGVAVLGILGFILVMLSPALASVGLILGLLFLVFMVLLGWAVNSKVMGLVYLELVKQEAA